MKRHVRLLLRARRGARAMACAIACVTTTVVGCASVVVSAMLASPVPASVVQAQPTSGRLQGTVQGAPRSGVGLVPLSYAVVELPARNVERFTDARGRFLQDDLPAGEYEVRVRRLGYSPWRGTVTITAGQTTALDVQLDLIPVRIGAATVQAIAACRAPGVPDARTHPEVALLVSLLRENALRFRLLATRHPFSYRTVRTMARLRPDAGVDAAVQVQSVDLLTDIVVANARYQAGRVVDRVPGRREEYQLSLPTVLDLADDAFARAHCFSFGGRETVDDATWYRLDVRASDRLSRPDVHGTFWIDSATVELRRMSIELSRPDRLPRQFQGVVDLRVETRLVEVAPGLSIIGDVCAITRLRRPPRSVVEPPVLLELQQLAGYRFARPPDGVASEVAFPEPWWRTGALLPRDTAWCVRG